MALHDIERINGITREETATGYIYNFPLEIIETRTSDGSMTRTQRGQTNSEYVRFVNIPDKKFSTSITDYCNKLCEQYYYRVNEGDAERIPLTTFEQQVIALGNDQMQLLHQIIFLLEKIAE